MKLVQIVELSANFSHLSYIAVGPIFKCVILILTNSDKNKSYSL